MHFSRKNLLKCKFGLANTSVKELKKKTGTGKASQKEVLNKKCTSLNGLAHAEQKLFWIYHQKNTILVSI